MKRHASLRSLIRTTVGVAALLAGLAARGTAADKAPRTQAQAQVLDHAELRCDNCFFGTSDYYYCFAADNKVLIGYQQTRVINWQDDRSNYLTKVHRAWSVWTPPGPAVALSYDDRHIWVTRENGKPLRLTQDYSRNIFVNNDQCRAAVQAKSH
jgi:hypothetical protein